MTGEKAQPTEARRLPPPAGRCPATMDGFRCAREAGHAGMHDCGWSFSDEAAVEAMIRDLREATR